LSKFRALELNSSTSKLAQPCSINYNFIIKKKKTMFNYLKIAILLFVPCILNAQKIPCLTFDGQNNQVVIGSKVNDLLNSNQFSIEMWVSGTLPDHKEFIPLLQNGEDSVKGFTFGFYRKYKKSTYRALYFGAG
jgi:hypothetical protein